MNFTVEGILVATLLILPGFAASSVQRVFIDQKGSEAQWVAVSALRSLFLNALTALSLTFAVKVIGLDILVQDFTNQLKLLTLQQVGLYLIVLYTLAISYGLAIGLLWKYARTIAFKVGWTPISPYEDVLTDALDGFFGSKENKNLSGDARQKRPWLWVRLDDRTDIFGALDRSSVHIHQDKPFEVFLKPIFLRGTDGNWQEVETPAGAEFVGAHLRIEPKTPLFIYSTPRDWPSNEKTAPATDAPRSRAAG